MNAWQFKSKSAHIPCVAVIDGSDGDITEEKSDPRVRLLNEWYTQVVRPKVLPIE
jgi:hypothetical protein